MGVGLLFERAHGGDEGLLRRTEHRHQHAEAQGVRPGGADVTLLLEVAGRGTLGGDPRLVHRFVAERRMPARHTLRRRAAEHALKRLKAAADQPLPLFRPHRPPSLRFGFIPRAPECST
jgi:hypothetical protein